MNRLRRTPPLDNDRVRDGRRAQTEPFAHALPYVIENFGADKILFASDYSHWDGLFPNAVSTLRKRTDISENAKQKILTDNAKRFYGWQS
ncbi:MAG: amidohydrolase family protein [Candidatus Binatia bacterium]